MRVFTRVRAFWRNVVHRAETERHMMDEWQFHLARHAERLEVQRGLAHGEAERRARLAFGSLEKYREETRRSLGLSFVDGVSRDLRYVWRIAAKQKGFTVAAVTILAVTIGANAAVYTVVDRLLVRSLPYPDADRLGTIIRYYERTGGTGDHTNGFVWLAMRDGVPDLDLALTGGDVSDVSLVAGHDTAYVRQQRVSSGFFRILGVAPALGREFRVDEDRPGGPSVVVLSHAVWARTLGADRNIVGQAITLRGEPFVVVGVMPEGFHSHLPSDVWTPLRPSTQGEGSGGNYGLIARLRPGARWADVANQVDLVGQTLIRERFHLPPNVRMSFRLVPWQDAVTREIRRPLVVLWSAVLVVLLIGCVNIASLLLARSSARGAEIATRMAIGGGRAAIVRQLLVESLVLGAAGAVAGIALASVLSGVISRQIETAIALPTGLDLRVVLIALAASLSTSVLFGLLPAVHASRTDVRSLLVEGAAAVAGPSRRWPTRLLVIAQVALGIVLVVAAGLLLRTFNQFMRLRSGVDATNVITATLSLQDARYNTSTRVNTLFAQSLERIRGIPGVEGAAVALSLPYERPLNDGWRLEGEPAPRPEAIAMTYVTPDYFRALRIPVLQGRVFDDHDTSTSPPVVVVNDAFVREYGAGRELLGHALRFGAAMAPTEIVGIVSSVQQRSTFGNFGPVAPLPGAYVPSTQFSGFTLAHTWFQPSWIVRTTGPISIVPSLRRSLREVDPQLAFREFRTIDDIRGEALATTRVQAWLLGGLAAIALTLCMTGVYGVVANSVVERRREFGVRLALGATPLQTLKTAAAAGITLTLVGTIGGLLLALFAIRLMRPFVFGVTVNDPLTLGVAATLVVLTGSAAALVPALRTLRLNVSSILSTKG